MISRNSTVFVRQVFNYTDSNILAAESKDVTPYAQQFRCDDSTGINQHVAWYGMGRW
ncbi:MAG: hypothetical protein OQL16_02105 [Gammaproteobacteria bacterium]|nr:hypothetical protein [Gammaproteobacteria bacterium]